MNLNYEESLEYFIVKADWLKYGLTHLIVVLDIDRDNRREVFYQYLGKANWREFQPDLHVAGDDNYDYVLFDGEANTVNRLYNAFKVHNGKLLIFNNDLVIRKKGLREIIEGGVCNSPETSERWDICPDGKTKFMFKGNVILLSSLTTQEFTGNKKYEWLRRDSLKSWG